MSRFLIDINPVLAAQYSDKNAVPLGTVYARSGKSAIWQCGDCGHEWNQIIIARTQIVARGNISHCPRCSSFGGMYPEYAQEWSTSNDKTPYDYLPGSRESLMWTCKLGHREWRSSISQRVNKGATCPSCRIPPPGKSVADLVPTNVLAEWSNRNIVSPQMMFAQSATMVWWECVDCSYEWQTRASYRVSRPLTSGCASCHNKIIADKSVAKMRPDIVSEWHARNKEMPTEVAIGSHKLMWWMCSEGHEYQMRPFERAEYICPICRRIEGSLFMNAFEVSEEFDTEKNGELTPLDFYAGTQKKVWWRCATLGHSWLASISARTSPDPTGCPVCNPSGTSKIEELLRNGLLSDGVITHIQEPQNSVVQLRWRRRNSLRLDVLGTYMSMPFACEYDGYYWHSGDARKDGTETIARDTAKTEALLAAGFIVVRVRESRGKTLLPDLPIVHDRLLQLHWDYLQGRNNTSLIREQIYTWLSSR